MNNEGQIVGFYTESPSQPLIPFLREASGDIIILEVPGAVSANAIGINDEGVTRDGTVNVQDLLEVILNWARC